MDDKKQTITLTLFQMYFWNDSRIIINSAHGNWKEIDGRHQKFIQLNSHFVKECLWVPKLQFLGANKLSTWNTSPTDVTGSEMEIFLRRDSSIMICTFNMKLTLKCNMKFDSFPFDRQVYLRICFKHVISMLSI